MAADLKCWNEWQPSLVMVVADFAMALLNIFLKKIVDAGTNHLVVITYRGALAAMFLSPIAYFWERKTRPKLTFSILCHLFISAMVGATATQFFLLLGMQYTSVTFACAFVNMVPAVTFLMALPFGLETVDVKRKSGAAKIIGTIVCVGGAMLLTFYKGMPLTNLSESRETLPHQTTNHVDWLSSNNKSERWTIGTISLFGALLFWSSWYLIQTRISKSYPCQYSSTAFMCFFTALQSATLSLISNRDMSSWVLKGKLEISAILYAGIVGSGLTFVGLSWCVKKRGPLFTAAFGPLVQIIVAFLDFSILHEQIHLGSILGSIIVIVGLYILLWGKSEEAKVLSVLKQVQLPDDHGINKEDQVLSP